MKMLEAKPFDEITESWKRENHCLHRLCSCQRRGPEAKPNCYARNPEVIAQFDVAVAWTFVRSWYYWSLKAFNRQIRPKTREITAQGGRFRHLDGHEKLYGWTRLYSTPVPKDATKLPEFLPFFRVFCLIFLWKKACRADLQACFLWKSATRRWKAMVSSRSPNDVLLIKFLLILPAQALQMYMEIMAFSEEHEAAMKDFIVSTSDQQQAVADSKPGCLSYPHTILELSQVITNICADIVQKGNFSDDFQHYMYHVRGILLSSFCRKFLVELTTVLKKFLWSSENVEALALVVLYWPNLIAFDPLPRSLPPHPLPTFLPTGKDDWLPIWCWWELA